MPQDIGANRTVEVSKNKIRIEIENPVPGASAFTTPAGAARAISEGRARWSGDKLLFLDSESASYGGDVQEPSPDWERNKTVYWNGSPVPQLLRPIRRRGGTGGAQHRPGEVRA
jgi:hypothetical protein